MSFPTFPKDPKSQLSKEKNKKEVEELGLVPCLYLTITFLIYALASIAAFIIMIVVVRTILLLLEVILGLIVMVALGIGPFTYEYLKKKSGFSKFMLVILLPIAILIGIYKSYRALFRSLFTRVLYLYKLDLTLNIRNIIDPIIDFWLNHSITFITFWFIH